MANDERALTYRVVMALARPMVSWWGRLEVVGLSTLPESGPVLMMVNHDSAWDPVVVGVATAPRRQIRALAKSSLWTFKPVGWVLNGMGQIPIERGRGDTEALSAAISALQAGACVGVFPEGTVSRGRPLRSLSGAGRLALAEPKAQIVGIAVTGAVDLVRFPKRPRVRVEFFDPEGGQPQPGETSIGLTRRVMKQVRAMAPPAVPGRSRKAAAFTAAVAEGSSK